jgi:predicted component of type VI protein secretion system
MNKKLVRVAMTVTLVSALSACGSKVARPVSELALADSALKNAETSGAREYAPIELRIAREKKVAADKAMSDKNYARAKYLTTEALADAELARVAADAEKSRLALREAQDNIELIRKEVRRTSSGQ